MKKLILLLILAFAFVMCGCIKAWDSLDIENNKEYVVRSVDFSKGQYIYGLQDVGETQTLLPNRAYAATEQYNIGDTIIIKVEVKD